jgi:signal transduction histidine kinase
VKHIRTAIFGLEQSRVDGEGVRDRVLALTGEAAGPLGFVPGVLFDGPIDTAVDERTAVELLATLREALSNVARHAHASTVEVEVVARPGRSSSASSTTASASRTVVRAGPGTASAT